MRIKLLPTTYWEFKYYNPKAYGYGDVDVFLNESQDIGERVVCILRKKDMLKYNDDKCTDIVFGILCNDCGVHSGLVDLTGLNAGQIVPIQFNKEYNPTIPLEWIEKKFWNL